MAAPIVFFDIAGTDAASLRKFYSSVFEWECSSSATFTTPVVSPLPATIRQDPADKLLYMGVNDIDATLTQIVAHGGAIDVPRFEAKGMRDGSPVVP